MLKRKVFCFLVFFFVNVFVGFLSAKSDGFDEWYKWDDPGFGESHGDVFGLSKHENRGLNLFDAWLVNNSFNFDVYYYDDVVIRDVLKNVDDAYRAIVDDLSYVFLCNPQRIKIYVYRSQSDYISKTESGRSWSGGYADVRKNSIFTFEQKDLMKNVMVHELTHLIFDSFMGFPRNMGINWLHEGLAVYEEKRFFDKKWNLKYLKNKDREGSLPSLRVAFATESGFERDSEKIARWYLQMGTVICFLFTLNRDGFKVFCENLKIYRNVEEALKYTYPWEFKNINELDVKWREWLYRQGDYM